jgi:hypothetical protein
MSTGPAWTKMSSRVVWGCQLWPWLKTESLQRGKAIRIFVKSTILKIDDLVILVKIWRRICTTSACKKAGAGTHDYNKEKGAHADLGESGPTSSVSWMHSPPVGRIWPTTCSYLIIKNLPSHHPADGLESCLVWSGLFGRFAYVFWLRMWEQDLYVI